jgi:hypothetical protein
MTWMTASARSIFAAHGYAPGATAKKHLKRTANAAVLQPCLRGTQTARFPLGVSPVGARRASECRRMVGSHYQLLLQLAWLAGQGC